MIFFCWKFAVLAFGCDRDRIRRSDAELPLIRFYYTSDNPHCRYLTPHVYVFFVVNNILKNYKYLIYRGLSCDLAWAKPICYLFATRIQLHIFSLRSALYYGFDQTACLVFWWANIVTRTQRHHLSSVEGKRVFVYYHRSRSPYINTALYTLLYSPKISLSPRSSLSLLSVSLEIPPRKHLETYAKTIT